MDVTENDARFALRCMALTFYLDVKSKQKDQVAISPNNESLSVVGLLSERLHHANAQITNRHPIKSIHLRY